MTKLLLKDEVYEVIGAAMEVHNELGSGFLEAVYHEAMEIEVGLRRIRFDSHFQLVVYYKGRPLQKRYEADLFTHDQVVIELKALNRLTTREESQLLHYLKATNQRVGLLINFGSRHKLEWKRFVA